jgi:hypothetical protein
VTTKQLFTILGVLVVFAAGIAVYAFAVMYPEAGRTSPSGLVPTATAVETLSPARAPITRKFSGTIRSLGQQTLVIALQHGRTTVTISIDRVTTYTSSSGPITLTALKVGQLIEVNGRVESGQGALTVAALSITLLPQGGIA